MIHTWQIKETDKVKYDDLPSESFRQVVWWVGGGRQWVYKTEKVLWASRISSWLFFLARPWVPSISFHLWPKPSLTKEDLLGFKVVLSISLGPVLAVMLTPCLWPLPLTTYMTVYLCGFPDVHSNLLIPGNIALPWTTWLVLSTTGPFYGLEIAAIVPYWTSWNNSIDPEQAHIHHVPLNSIILTALEAIPIDKLVPVSLDPAL